MPFRTVMGKSQANLLLDYFKRHRDISHFEASGMFKIRSLSRRINDLEENGYRFFREGKVDDTGQRYTRYHYLGHGVPETQLRPTGRGKLRDMYGDMDGLR